MYHDKLILSCFLSLVFCWCLPYKRQAQFSQHIWVPVAVLSFFHSEYILMEAFTLLVRQGSHVFRGEKKSK
jgi:hypothetical protein